MHGGDLFKVLFKDVRSSNYVKAMRNGHNYRKIQTSQDLISIADQCGQAIAYVHGLNPPMLHRDIKLTNILVSLQSASEIAKLTSLKLTMRNLFMHISFIYTLV